jgi:hypothetical protein
VKDETMILVGLVALWLVTRPKEEEAAPVDPTPWAGLTPPDPQSIYDFFAGLGGGATDGAAA